MTKTNSNKKQAASRGLLLRLTSTAKRALKSIVALLTAGLCVLLLVAAYSDLIPPTLLITPSFLGISLGILTMLALVWMVVLIISHRWRCLAVLVVSLLLIWDPVSRVCPLHLTGGNTSLDTTADGQKTGQSDTIKVFSFNTNIMGQTHLSRIKEHIQVIDLVRQSGADICCLQEYGFSLSKNGHTEQELRSRLKDLYPYYDYTPNDKRKALGIAILSKYPIRKAERIDKRKKGYFSAMYYQLQLPNGQMLGVVNMHLRSNMIAPKDRQLADEMIDHFEADSISRIRTGMLRALGKAFRLRSAEAVAIRDFLHSNHPEGMPLLVCGDMNDTPVSYCHRTLRNVGLSDTWQETGLGPGTTYRKHHFWFRIDHLLHSPELRALRMRVRKDVTISDHYPIEATYQIMPE